MVRRASPRGDPRRLDAAVPSSREVERPEKLRQHETVELPTVELVAQSARVSRLPPKGRLFGYAAHLVGTSTSICTTRLCLAPMPENCADSTSRRHPRSAGPAGVVHISREPGRLSSKPPFLLVSALRALSATRDRAQLLLSSPSTAPDTVPRSAGPRLWPAAASPKRVLRPVPAADGVGPLASIK